jgi:hypothetical protein
MACDERSELETLVMRLKQFELNGDVGRMVFLAVENAVDEKQCEDAARSSRRRTRAPHEADVRHDSAE